MNLSDQLRKAMEKSGFSLHALSVETGIDYAAIHRFYHGERDMRLGTASRLAGFLGLKLVQVGKPKKKGG